MKSNEARLRRQLGWSSTLAAGAVLLAAAVDETVGALIALPAYGALILAIHRLGRLGSD